ncbi:integrase core domain protein [Hydrogenophaga sp. RAC07]|uniref:DDE-type integrase/transposase/recombinase n=1 Tax=Hydrogenophaga sp. RAC07 TaxID=1842537 RepID=UPI00083E5294|nr:DDE-type integrase/transposase/recombinase [Hydrogenophaga sp. RAC07]AOF88158.1 integrase core domain protein [Hydrogenophaga sp. RAC07]
MIEPNLLLLVPPGIQNFKPGVHRVVTSAPREKQVALFWMGAALTDGPLKPGAHCKKPRVFLLAKLQGYIDDRLIQALPEVTIDAAPNRYRIEAAKSTRFERNRQILSPLVTPDMLFSMIHHGQWRLRITEAAEKHKVNAITVQRLLIRYFVLGMNLDWACEDRLWVKGTQRNVTTKLGRPSNRFKSGHRTSAEGRNVTKDDQRIIEVFYDSLEDQAMSAAEMYRRFEEDFSPRKAVTSQDGNLELISDTSQAFLSDRQFRYWLSKIKGDLILLQNEADERRINLSHRPAIGSARDRVPYPGHTYIIDATVGDVYLVSAFDRRRIIGRPVIYLVVDAFSSLIVSVHVALDGPNFAQARIAMCRAISDKSLWLAWLGLSKLGHLLPQGCVPTFWLADRGELHSQASRTLQTELRTNLSIAAAYRADWKSLVERLFGILNTMMIHWMPGAVVQRYRERGSPDNRLDAVLTLQEFTRMLVRKVAILNLTRDMSMHMSAALLSADVRPNPLGFFTHGIRYKHGSAVFLDHQSSMRKTLATSDATIGRHVVMMGKAQYAASWMLDHPVVQVAGFEGNSPVKCIVSPDDPLSAWCMLPNEQTMREVRLQRGLQRASHFCAEDIQEMDALRTFLGQDLKDDTTAERLTIERENRLEVENAKLQAQAAIRGAPVSKNSRIKGVRSNRQKEIDGTEPLDTQEQTATATATATASLPGAPRSPKNFSPSQEDLNERSSGKQDQDYFERLSAQLSSWEHS